MTGFKTSAFVFPAFAQVTNSDPLSLFPDAKALFEELISTHSSIRIPITTFNDSLPTLEQELHNQIVTCGYSLAMAQTLRNHRLSPDYSCGYSMGIYAALADAGAITIAQAFQLIYTAHETILSILGNQSFGMCGVIGLTRNDILDIFTSHHFSIEISNQNSEVNYVLSGLSNEIESFCKIATEEGALHSRLIATTIPFHSSLLHGTHDTFTQIVKQFEIQRPNHALVSTINQQLLSTPDHIRRELVQNLYHPFQWYQTQMDLLNRGVDLFVECGIGNNLTKNAKFIEGNFQFLTFQDILKKVIS